MNTWFLSKYSLTFKKTLHYVLHDTYSEPCLLLKLQTYSGIFTSCSDTFSHIEPYLEPCEFLHIQNPDIFRSQVIFRTLSKHILAYSVACLTLAFWKTCFTQNFIFRISALRNFRHSQNPAYLGTFRPIQTYSGFELNII